MSNNNEEFWKGVAYITGDLIILDTLLKTVKWHIRWYDNLDRNIKATTNNHHSSDINYCYQILFWSLDMNCGNGIVEECNCPIGVKNG